MLFGVHYLKATPTSYILHYSNGRVVREGAGRSFFYLGPSSTIVSVPLASADVPFAFTEVSADFQSIQVQGQLTFRIVEPKKVAGLLNFTVAPNGRYLTDERAYLAAKVTAAEVVRAAAAAETALLVDVVVNAADDPARGSLYLTVTGTSAEAGDDGEVGRGNRASGLITPYRLMTLEAVCGKNPVTHVGKLYPLVAERIAVRLCSERPEIASAECLLVSRIGHPVTDPLLADVMLTLRDPKSPMPGVEDVLPVVRSVLASLPALTDDVLAGRLRVA